MDKKLSLNPATFAEASPEQRQLDIWRYVQRGLVYPAPHAIFATYWLKRDSLTRQELTFIMAELRHTIHNSPTLGSCHSSAVVGTSFPLWKQFCLDDDLPIPEGMKLQFPSEGDPNTSTVFERSSGSFENLHGDLWFHIKSDKPEACEMIQQLTTKLLGTRVTDMVAQPAASKSDQEDGKNGKVLGCRFSENLNNPADPITISKHSITGAEDIDHLGSSYVLAQRFLINWDQIKAMSEDQIEDLIGRKTDDTIIPNRDTRSHIKSARLEDEQGNTTPILRLGLPFGKAALFSSDKTAPKGTTASDERGIYFAGFAKSAPILENIMNNQIGPVPGFMNDRLFNNLKSDLGGLFYVPSIKDLALDVEPKYDNDFSCLEDGDWSHFPGVDWSRLDRHFDKASGNGLMFYNHKNYLYRMSTLPDEDKGTLHPPTTRILSLLENSFSRWQDNWYVDRKQQEIKGDLQFYMNQYRGEDKPVDVMSESIMVRKGWATRLTLHLLASQEYGFRGRRIRLPDGTLVPYAGQELTDNTEIINGADTYRIQPEEIIVGAMPNLSLGEGRYVMRYLTDTERMDGFLQNLSEASGVGHVIPDYELLLEKGLGALIQDLKVRQQSTADKDKQEFYQSSMISLKGVSEHMIRYADLARAMAKKMGASQIWEITNLKIIEARMRKLSMDRPSSFVEAVQLLFSVHSCLHLTGEPTALGRLDQILLPYFEGDSITQTEALEIIDAFYIKLDEKVQQNRIFMEDHQPFGNLAMGGSSGPYPQGASLGQWIQQITVGGTIADNDDESKPAYNDLTRLFIRASAHLPLNAPCLSLRTRKDIPDDLLQEAATAILSGGAHPILLNDELLVPGLHHSGNNVGGADMEETSQGKWRSTVELRSARNYACDGCYEPQFPGENWFSLGGFSTLQPLECALNKGRTYSSAGENYLTGQVVSFTSKPAGAISSFEELIALYLEHFEWLNRKAINGQLMSFGANTAFCPSPLLSVLVHDCVERGLDFYSGGARYNIYGPCYIALSSTINSLYAIKKMVFDERDAVTTLSELFECLACDWGYKMTEPFVSSLSGEARIAARADRFKRLREIALSLPRYGRGHPEIDALGDEIVANIADIAVKTFTLPLPQTRARLEDLARAYGTESQPFGIQIQPGVGTFENHVEMGAWNGASADGRRQGTTVASDLSPAPSPADLPVDHQETVFKSSLSGFAGKGARVMSDGAPTDFNIREDFPHTALVDVLRQFAQGESSNILTITVSDPLTFSEATDHPEMYDLLRVRTGGWSNYFTSVFPVIQQQHRRRPLSTPE
ncbi:formate acetyltransferase [Hahella sp. CCB-MM4]|uniref:Dyp-type peroxidase n=1 Tax=Hahella sp. (strain CCB-MM4) TaxID=1926491 RepID=UPI000B9C4383|nr:Dyp-type peroxidase [Hahella sp. CCB-MM4]OZG74122.1 formate acetyltransferase [Hahella sp. CCB-MM4]